MTLQDLFKNGSSHVLKDSFVDTL